MEGGDEFEASLPWPEFRQIHAYWRARCSAGRLPGRADIDPVDLAPLLPRIYLVDVIRSDDHPVLGFRYRLLGTEHLQINGRELTGMTLDEAMDKGRGEALRAVYTDVVNSRRPLLTLSARPALIGRAHVVYDRLLLPLASDGDTVDVLLGYFHRRTA